MSYILDALKKAEAERNAGATPSIHATQPLATVSVGTAIPAWRRLWPWLLLIVLLAAALTGVATWKLSVPTPVPSASPVRASGDASEHPPIPEAPANTAAVSTAPILQPAPAPAPLRTEPRKTEKKTEKATALENKPTAGTTLPSLRELPEQIQRQIPPLEIGGYIYSSIPAERSVLINKRLMREGDEIAPGFRLEKMAANGMVLNYKGYRYRSSY